MVFVETESGSLVNLDKFDQIFCKSGQIWLHRPDIDDSVNVTLFNGTEEEAEQIFEQLKREINVIMGKSWARHVHREEDCR